MDGAFWHGHPSAYTPGRHGDYWDEKIRRNIERDRAADEALKAMGWTVIRIWDFDVRRDVAGTAGTVIEALEAQASGSPAPV